MAEAARACSNQWRTLIGSWVTPPTIGDIKIERGGDENITINHGCGGGNFGGGSNSGGDDGGNGGNDGGGGGRENDGGVGCGRADDDGDDEDDDGGYGGGKSNNVTTVTGTVAMGFAVWSRVVGNKTGIGNGGKSDGNGAMIPLRLSSYLVINR